jgi:hypothetical protein
MVLDLTGKYFLSEDLELCSCQRAHVRFFANNHLITPDIHDGTFRRDTNSIIAQYNFHIIPLIF